MDSFYYCFFFSPNHWQHYTQPEFLLLRIVTLIYLVSPCIQETIYTYKIAYNLKHLKMIHYVYAAVGTHKHSRSVTHTDTDGAELFD